MATNTYDAIIVGSGITGGWAAKELTEKGLNTLILEAGRTIVPEKDYVEHVPVYELKYRGSSATRKTLTPSIPTRNLPGFADARLGENPSPGAARAIAGAISISKPT
jgi:choline dehydrogenase-like flavoprotein